MQKPLGLHHVQTQYIHTFLREQMGTVMYVTTIELLELANSTSIELLIPCSRCANHPCLWLLRPLSMLVA